MLYIFGGLPATGKTTFTTQLARRIGAVHLRIDTIEQALRDSGVRVDGPDGYCVAYAVATGNLRLGRTVVADSVNPIELTREAWRAVARTAGSAFAEIEVVCADAAEHRRRAETRTLDITNLAAPIWDDIVRREYAPWTNSHVVVDTAGSSPDASMARPCAALGLP